MSFVNSFLLRRFEDLEGTRSIVKGEVADRGKLGKIVVAEANPSDLEHIASILRGLKFTVLTAQDGKTALTLVRRHSPSLVLAALNLPRISGYMLAQKLREHKETEEIPFMFIVESGELPDRIVGHETYANDYIQKPISVPEFESRILGLINLVRSRSAPTRPRRSRSETPDRSRGGTPEGAPKPSPASPSVPEDSVTLAVSRIRLLLGELSKNLGILERKARLSVALAESELFEEDAESRSLSSKSPDCCSIVSFQARSHVSEQGAVAGFPDAETPASDVGPAGESPDPEWARRQKSLQLLESYRDEFRRLTGLASTTETERFEQDKHDLSPESVSDLKEDSSEPVPYAVDDIEKVEAMSPEASAVEALVLEFDTELLARLGVNVEGPAYQKIKAEEFTSFARQSFLSAFLDENERPRRLESLYEEARDFVYRSIRRAAVGGVPYGPRAESLIRSLADSLEEGDELLSQASDREQPFSISSHSVNVAVLSLRVARTLGRSDVFLMRVGLAALFHEIGVVKLPERLIFKEEPLSEDELRTLRKRPLFSAKVLKEAFGVVSDVVGQIFERENGMGHPLGLREAEIRDEAKIIGVCDFFEACIHKRPYRKPLTGYHTLYELSRDGEFQQGAVRGLARSVSLFPFNEILMLSTGEVARVVGVNRERLAKPRVSVILDPRGQEVSEVLERDLAVETSVSVVEVLTPDDLALKRVRS